MKVAVKLIGELTVGSAWPPARSMETLGAVESATKVKATVLSTAVLAVLGFLAPSMAGPGEEVDDDVPGGVHAGDGDVEDARATGDVGREGTAGGAALDSHRCCRTRTPLR